MADLDSKLHEYLADTHALEKSVLRQLETLISSTEDDSMRADFEHHREETQRQLERLERRLDAHGESSTVKDAGAQVAAFFKGIGDAMRGDKPGKNARDAYVTEHLEIAAYELLERLAERAGDTETAEVARTNRAEEEAMARKLAGRWDLVIDRTLAEEGIEAPAGGSGRFGRTSETEAPATTGTSSAPPLT